MLLAAQKSFLEHRTHRWHSSSSTAGAQSLAMWYTTRSRWGSRQSRSCGKAWAWHGTPARHSQTPAATACLCVHPCCYVVSPAVVLAALHVSGWCKPSEHGACMLQSTGTAASVWSPVMHGTLCAGFGFRGSLGYMEVNQVTTVEVHDALLCTI